MNEDMEDQLITTSQERLALCDIRESEPLTQNVHHRLRLVFSLDVLSLIWPEYTTRGETLVIFVNLCADV